MNGKEGRHPIEFELNKCTVTAVVRTDQTLLDLLRREFKLFGVRETCGIGICGTCTVLVDGRPLSSCLLLAPVADGSAIVTVEGLGAGSRLHPVQQAYLENTGFQCSYCTPGMIVATVALLAENPQPTVEEIKEYLAGNLCRCGSYVKIIDSVLAASQRLRAHD